MIELGEDYKITADKHQYVLHTRTEAVAKDAKFPYVWNKTFHATIKQCCAAIVDKQAKQAIQVNLLDEFIPSIDRLCLAVNLAKADGKGE